MENANKSRFWKSKAAITAFVLVFVLAAGAVGLHAFNAWFGTALTINDSFENFGDEFVQRIETTPLTSIYRLSEAGHEGVITADVNVRQAGLFGINGDINARFYSSIENESFALMLNAAVMGMDFDARMFVDGDSVAIGSDAFLGDGNFGVFYDTFRTDAQNFFNLMDLTQRDLEDVAEVLDLMAEQFRNAFASLNEDGEHNIQPYLTMLNNFINSIEQDRLNTSVNGVSVERISLEIRNDDLVRLLSDLYDIIAEDNYIRLLMDARDAQDPWMRAGNSSFEWMLEDLRYAVEELQDLDEEILITINFYIGNGNRLARLYLGVDVENDYVAIIMDMGTHALDTWTLEISNTQTFLQKETTETILVVWTLTDHAGTYENRITVTSPNWRGEMEAVAFYSIWTPVGGDFTLGFENQWEDDMSFGGNLVITDDAMTLRFDDIVVDDVTISIEIGAEVGVALPQATFTNISEWDQDLIDHVEQQIAAFMFMASLLGLAL
ncbi:MAG: hypothetical protein FWD97_10165 [Defluviitaleaceae bacterium]|nr:hypothetical protein [Defluviitaleaceae bacterium]